MAATPLADVAAEIARAYPDGVPLAGRVLVEDPARGLERLVAKIRAFWDALLVPSWNRTGRGAGERDSLAGTATSACG